MKIKINADCLAKIKAFAMVKPALEVSGFACYDGLKILNPFILAQDVSTVNTELDIKCIRRLQKRSDIHSIKVHWHSHGKMSTFFSSTDDETYRTLSSCFGYVIAIVVNSQGEIKCKLVVGDAEASVELEPIFLLSTKTLSFIKKEVDSKVKEIKVLVADTKHKTWYPSYHQPGERSSGSDSYEGGFGCYKGENYD